MELFTADGLPVGPAAQFSRDPGNAADLPLPAGVGSQLVTLYRLFVRLHSAGGAAAEEAGSTNTSNSGGGAVKTGAVAGGNGSRNDGTALATRAGGRSSLVMSLAAALKPEGEHRLLSLMGMGDGGGGGGGRHGVAGLPSATSDPSFQLAGGDVGHLRGHDGLDPDGAFSFMGSSAAEWAQVLGLAVSGGTGGGGSAALLMLSGAVTYPFLLLPSRFSPHVSRLRGYPALPTTPPDGFAGSASGQTAQSVADGSDESTDGMAQLPVVVLNSNRSAQLVDEVPLRYALCHATAATARRAEHSAATPGSEGAIPSNSPSTAGATEHDPPPQQQQQREGADGGEADGEACEAIATAAAAANRSSAGTSSGEGADGDPPSATALDRAAGEVPAVVAAPDPHGGGHGTDKSLVFHAGQLMVESSARRWFCVPAETHVPSGRGVPGEYDFACILFGCGVAPV